MSNSEFCPSKRCVFVCKNSSCFKQGSDQIFTLFKNSNLPDNISIIASECQGQCSVGPTVRITPEETWYYRVKPEDVRLIVEQDLWGGKIVESKLNPRIHFPF